MTRSARDASAFIRDENVDSGMRCLVHDADWNVCGCYCKDDRHCSTCDEWSSGLHDTPTSCVWCGRPFIGSSEQPLRTSVGMEREA